MNILKALKSLTKFEIGLWAVSVSVITASFILSKGGDVLSFVASLIGVTSLIFLARGFAFGQVLMIIFGLIYGFISFGFAYYGEMMTYVGMTVPMAVVALVSWLRNPYESGKAEVRINRIKVTEVILMLILTAAVTVAFYFILAAFGTSNILPSTLSVTTSFIAVYLTARRSPYFALAYAANDVVLIILWVLASFSDISYISVVICFAVFLINDLYGFVNWRKMEKRQRG